ncbi:DUF4170 domain-containing protein [Methyloligella solikamskensis]|uniref:DUF4170 domain-containing protein n=1 Tax=Methyloligella solikamskensis TaxID=1177756 RepID=A0ABW3JDH9_9HYPH
MAETVAPKSQVLHLVFGGELKDLDGVAFKNPDALDMIGIFPDYEAAYNAWKDVSHRNLDDALRRYFIVDLQSLIDPSK